MIDEAILLDIEEQRRACPHRGKTDLIKRHAEALGVAPSTLHRQLQKLRGRVKSGGERKSRIADDIIHEIARRKVKSAKEGYGRELTTEQVLADLAAEGVEGLPSRSHADTRLRKLGLRETRTFRSFEADHANEFCLLDFSRSKHFQLVGLENGAWTVEARVEEMSYKANNKKLRTWIVLYVDRYSGLFVARIYPASGESILLGLEHLDHVWTRPDDGHPLRYVPEILQTDRGSLGKSGPFKVAMQALGVDAREAQAKEAQGAVERRFRYLWQSFEAALFETLGKGARLPLDELNERLAEFAHAYGQRRHPQHPGRTREEVYRASLRVHTPREFDSSVFTLACRVETRRVDAYGCVTLGGERFAVPQYVGSKDRVPTIGATIRVLRNAEGAVVGELLDRFAEPFRLAPWTANGVGEYRTHAAPTLREQIERDLAADRAKAKAEARKAGRPKTLPARPERVEPSGPFAHVEASEGLLAQHAARALAGRLLASERLRVADFAHVLDPLLSQARIARADVEQVCGAILTHHRAQRTPLRRAS